MQGVLGAFHELDSAVHAVEDLKKGKYGDVTVFTPTPRHEFDEAIGAPESPVRPTWVPYTIYGFEVMVLIGGLATVFAMFFHSRIPRLTTTVGYDPRFSHGDFGVWVAAPPERVTEVMDLLRRHGAQEVRSER
jgi:hypothetical protein